MTGTDSTEMREALHDEDGAGAVALLRDPAASDDELMARMGELFGSLAYGNWTARAVAARLDRATLERSWEFAEPTLDGSDGQPFRELAGFYEEHALGADLNRLLTRARLHRTDPDIAEVIDDFGPDRRHDDGEPT